jgi:hypothetical protein
MAPGQVGLSSQGGRVEAGRGRARREFRVNGRLLIMVLAAGLLLSSDQYVLAVRCVLFKVSVNDKVVFEMLILPSHQSEDRVTPRPGWGLSESRPF